MGRTGVFANSEDLSDEAFRHRLTDEPHRLIYDYWRARVRNGRLPGRADFDPVDVPSVLRFLVLVDLSLAARTVRFRVFGTEAQSFWGEDHTGADLADITTGDYYDYICGLYFGCAERRAPVLGDSLFRWDRDRSVVARRLFLPFAANGTVVDQVLLCQVFDFSDDYRREPLRVTGPPVSVRELTLAVGMQG